MCTARRHLCNFTLSRTTLTTEYPRGDSICLFSPSEFESPLLLHNCCRQSAPTDQSNKENCRFEALIKSIRHYLIKENLYDSTYSKIEGAHSFGVLQIIHHAMSGPSPCLQRRKRQQIKTTGLPCILFKLSSSQFQHGGSTGLQERMAICKRLSFIHNTLHIP